MEEEEPFAECTTCQKSFNGPESYNDHLASKNHEKKMIEARKTMMYSPTENAASANSSEPKLHCKICDVTLNGQEPFNQHINGNKHLSKVKKQDILNSIELIETPKVDSAGVLKCETCSKCFSGPESFQQHLHSKKHARKMELKSMKSQLDGTNNKPSCPPMEMAANSTEPNFPSRNIYPNLSEDYKIVHDTIAKTRDDPKKPLNKGKGCFSGFKALFKKNKIPKETVDEE